MSAKTIGTNSEKGKYLIYVIFWFYFRLVVLTLVSRQTSDSTLLTNKKKRKNEDSITDCRYVKITFPCIYEPVY